MEVKRKKAQVIMLPTEHGDNIPILKSLRHEGSKHHLYIATQNYYYTQSYLREREWEANHLYITTDEEIKKGDWVIQVYQNNKSVVNTHQSESLRAFKIIATTDESLQWLDKSEKNIELGRPNGLWKPLPKPSQAFIEQYCREGGIDEVMVEYERKTFWIDEGRDSYSDLVLKVNSHNNTITIRPIKNSWTEEEMFKIINDILKKSYKSIKDIPKEKLNNYLNQ